MNKSAKINIETKIIKWFSVINKDKKIDLNKYRIQSMAEFKIHSKDTNIVITRNGVSHPVPRETALELHRIFCKCVSSRDTSHIKSIKKLTCIFDTECVADVSGDAHSESDDEPSPVVISRKPDTDSDEEPVKKVAKPVKATRNRKGRKASVVKADSDSE